MSGLVEFLRARLAEEQAEAEKLADVDDYPLDPWEIKWEETGEWNSYTYLRIAKARALNEVGAKRALLYQFEHRGNSVRAVVTPSTGGVWDDLLRLLALPYRDHPEYQKEWAP